MISLLKKVKVHIVDILDSLWSKSLDHKLTHHKGKPLSGDKKLRYRNILIVEDVPKYSEILSMAIQEHYTDGDVFIHQAFNYTSASILFSVEHIDLVVMDFDLQDDAGDGALLTRRIVAEKPFVPVLANSYNESFNRKLLDVGAAAVICKDSSLLKNWLLQNDSEWKKQPGPSDHPN